MFKWLILAPLLLILVVQLWYFGWIVWWNFNNPRVTSMMSLQQEALLEKNPRARIYQTWVPYSAISNNLKRAIVASEDANFAEHDGVDWDALQKAYEKNNKRHRIAGGGSTITQQLAKNLFLSGSRSYIRKAQEMVIAFMLEAVMSKQRILEIYLNVVEFGQGTFGAEAAARHYYRISAAQLNPEQASRLAVMLPNPRYYDKHRDTRYLAKRTNFILRQLHAAELP
ncbi:monofunctional biosynthetic peptidoglycan transglycosylase [Massilia arenosa]|uniref:Biosynthetic peptidoglycan transglycosylase n=2 Tax=Zemynaea arenosa TaxID=2561931 RepID=A0A4Y9SPD0_9BURK|nr:monofunctional biosynthetic peptidoglycan transglycosylase [Massilia arenosa]